MDAQRTPGQPQFHLRGRRQAVGQFDGGRSTSDVRGMLLRETDLRLGLLKRLAQCVLDYRTPNGVEHCIEALLRQRVYAPALCLVVCRQPNRPRNGL